MAFGDDFDRARAARDAFDSGERLPDWTNQLGEAHRWVRWGAALEFPAGLLPPELAVPNQFVWAEAPYPLVWVVQAIALGTPTVGNDFRLTLNAGVGSAETQFSVPLAVVDPAAKTQLGFQTLMPGRFLRATLTPDYTAAALSPVQVTCIAAPMFGAPWFDRRGR